MAEVEMVAHGGVDGGATNVTIAHSGPEGLLHFIASEQPSMDHILDTYMGGVAQQPEILAVAMPGTEDENGAVTPTNNSELRWPPFNPQETAKRLGITILMRNDLEVATYFVVGTQASYADETTGKVGLKNIKAGTKIDKEPIAVVAHSSGVGKGRAIYNPREGRYVVGKSEGGHMGWQPEDEWELGFLNFMNIFSPFDASAEIALSGLYGLDHLFNYMVLNSGDRSRFSPLRDAVNEARLEKRPIGEVLLGFAQSPEISVSQCVAAELLSHMGAMTGSVLHDVAVDEVAKNGIYTFGGVAQGLYEYFTEHTDFLKRFLRRGAKHADWVERVPIYLLTDPNAAALGALALAREQVETGSYLSNQ